MESSEALLSASRDARARARRLGTCGLIVAGLLACGPVQAPRPAYRTQAPTEYTATLTRDRDSWIVHYRFPEPQSALLFDTAHGAYRARHWTTLDDGAELVNLDGLDALFFDPPASEARLQIRPPTDDFGGTRPFLRFSDQSLAFYSGQLALLTVESREAAESLHGDLSRWRGHQPPVRVLFEADGPVVTDRMEAPGLVSVTARLGAGPYLYPGPVPAVRTEASTLVLDPGLPGWLRARVPEDLAAVDTALERRWRSDIPDATSLLAWEGPDEDWENTGRAEGLQITMSIRGSRYLDPDPEALADLVWFFAHERAHHFQLASGASIEPWPLEGSADTMATLILVDLGLLDPRALQRRYARVQHECAQELARGPLDSQTGRGAHACGDLISLGTLHLLPDRDLFGFWREMLEAAEVQGARIDTSFYLYFLRRRHQEIDEEALTAIQRFATESHSDADAATIALLSTMGLDPVFDREAGLQSLRIDPSPR